MRSFSGCLSLSICVFTASADVVGAAEPVLTETGTTEAFVEISAEDHREAKGFYFSVSPDEQWIVVVHEKRFDGEPSRSNELELWTYHIPSRRKWVTEAGPTAYPFGGYNYPVRLNNFGDWYPNCYSEDSSRLYVGEFSAPLSAEMRELELQRDAAPKNLEAFGGFFLSLPSEFRTRHGIAASSWSTPGLDRFAIAWGPGGRVLYEIVEWRKNQNQIRVTPPGATRLVDFALLVQARGKLSVEEVEAAFEGTPTPQQREFANGVSELAGALDDLALTTTKLQDPVISPNGRWIAANTCFPNGFGCGRGEGVLIDLEEDVFRARPYSAPSESVWGAPMWSGDSKRLYFYGRTSEKVSPTRTRSIYTVYRHHLRD